MLLPQRENDRTWISSWKDALPLPLVARSLGGCFALWLGLLRRNYCVVVLLRAKWSVSDVEGSRSSFVSFLFLYLFQVTHHYFNGL
jgi:hypothetical protein